MTTDELRVKLAERLGWTEIQMSMNPGTSGKTLFTAGSSLHGVIPGDAGKPEDDQSFIRLPDLATLVRTAEQGLSEEQQAAYVDRLLRPASKSADILFRAITASDEDRAASLLGVL